MTLIFKKPKANTRRQWSKEEEEKLLKLIEKGLSPSEILAYFPDRSMISIKNKIRKLRIKYNLYGFDHQDKKSKILEKWLKRIKPKTVLEGFAGHGNLTKVYLGFAEEICAVEINKQIFKRLKENLEKILNLKAKKIENANNVQIYKIKGNNKVIFLINSDIRDAIHYLAYHGYKFDFIDLDPCGTPIPFIPLIPKISKVGSHIAITYGDYHSLRFKRYDVLAKTIPILFDIRLREGFNLRLNKISFNEFISYLLIWTCLLWILPQDVQNLVYLRLVEKHKFNGCILRALFRVEKGKANAQVLRYIQSLLK